MTSLWIIQTLAMLEKNEQALMKKVAAEIEKAKEFTKTNNKRGGCCNQLSEIPSRIISCYQSLFSDGIIQ